MKTALHFLVYLVVAMSGMFFVERYVVAPTSVIMLCGYFTFLAAGLISDRLVK